jgi:hypothetical protein
MKPMDNHFAPHTVNDEQLFDAIIGIAQDIRAQVSGETIGHARRDDALEDVAQDFTLAKALNPIETRERHPRSGRYRRTIERRFKS